MKALDKLIVRKKKARTDLTGTVTMLYGEKKSGKSTEAARFPKPLFLDCEDGLRTVALPDGNMPDHIPIRNWETLMDVTTALEGGASEDYETLVVDGMAELTNHLANKLMAEHKAKHLNDGNLGYGTGKDLIIREFREWFARIRTLDLTLVLVAHDRLAEMEQNGVKFDKRIPLLDTGKRGIEVWDGMKPSINSYFYVWKEQTSDGIEHKMRCQGNNMVDAGNPFNLPEVITFSYDQLTKGIEACKE